MDYQWEKLLTKKSKSLKSWQPRFGPRVLSRDEKGKAKEVLFNLYIDTLPEDVYLVGDFNGWEKKEDYKLKKNNGFASIVIKASHKDEYKFLVKNNFFQDPASTYFSDTGNSVFWDFEDPSCYKKKYGLQKINGKSLKIMQTDLPGLIVHFSDGEKKGSDVSKKDYYDFVTSSGVIKEIKKLGFNAVQFLPFAQSIDGDNWKYRYLVPFQYAVQKNWGDPDSFARMIDKFHEEGIAVIGDFVVGHIPYKDYFIFGEKSDDNGLHVWKKESGESVYLGEETSWGTKRLDYDNPLIREFFIDSCLSFLKNYFIDGFRIDNVDGIIRYGESGEGQERANGRTFLRELTSNIYDYNCEAFISFEAHYFFEDNAKLLVSPITNCDRSLGATAYNESRLTYYFHRFYMLEKIDDISTWKFKHICEEKEWGKSNSTVADFHNHDAAAGLMSQRATGSYAYDAMTQDKSNHIHAVGKIKVMEAIISFCAEGRTLDLLQTFLLQTGTFEHDSSIHWFKTFNELNRSVVNYKKEVNNLLDDKAFYPINVKNRVFLNVDENNKILIVERSSEESRFVIIINLGSWKHHSYKVGVKTSTPYKLVLNSDEFKYGGLGLINYPEEFIPMPSTNFEFLDKEIVLPFIAPYGVIVLKEIN